MERAFPGQQVVGIAPRLSPPTMSFKASLVERPATVDRVGVAARTGHHKASPHRPQAAGGGRQGSHHGSVGHSAWSMAMTTQ